MMKLVGQYDSPYTRRVAISLHTYNMEFEQRPLSLFADFDEMKAINPLVRIPSLILDDGEVLIDSNAILDYLDELVGPNKTLTPVSGKARRDALKIIAIATGAIDKAMSINYERNQRPEDKIYTPWIDRLSVQLAGALSALDDLPQTPWLLGDSLSQTDITTAVMVGYLRIYSDDILGVNRYSNLETLCKHCESLPAFSACLPSPENIGGDAEQAKLAIKRMRGTN